MIYDYSEISEEQWNKIITWKYDTFFFSSRYNNYSGLHIFPYHPVVFNQKSFNIYTAQQDQESFWYVKSALRLINSLLRQLFRSHFFFFFFLSFVIITLRWQLGCIRCSLIGPFKNKRTMESRDCETDSKVDGWIVRHCFEAASSQNLAHARGKYTCTCIRIQEESKGEKGVDVYIFYLYVSYASCCCCLSVSKEGRKR